MKWTSWPTGWPISFARTQPEVEYAGDSISQLVFEAYVEPMLRIRMPQYGNSLVVEVADAKLEEQYLLTGQAEPGVKVFRRFKDDHEARQWAVSIFERYKLLASEVETERGVALLPLLDPPLAPGATPPADKPFFELVRVEVLTGRGWRQIRLTSNKSLVAEDVP
jgi:hypothetical protein